MGMCERKFKTRSSAQRLYGQALAETSELNYSFGLYRFVAVKPHNRLAVQHDYCHQLSPLYFISMLLNLKPHPLLSLNRNHTLETFVPSSHVPSSHQIVIISNFYFKYYFGSLNIIIISLMRVGWEQ